RMARMPHGAGMDAARVAKDLADEIEIVDGVKRDLHTRRLQQEFPKLPRGVERQPGVEINDFSKQAFGDSILQRQHHRREAELEINRRDELLATTHLEDRRCALEIGTHGLLDQRDRAIWE